MKARVTAVITAIIPTLVKAPYLLPNLSTTKPMKKHPIISPAPKAIIAKTALED